MIKIIIVLFITTTIAIDSISTLPNQYEVQWENVQTTGTKPRARSQYSSIIKGDLLYICGGLINFDVLNDCFSFNTVTKKFDVMSMRTEGVALPQLRRHSAVLSGDERFMIVFGGIDGESHLPSDRVFVYHFEEDVWSVGVRSPEAVSGHSAVTLPDGRMLVHGGQGMVEIFRKTWILEYDVDANYFQWEEIETISVSGELPSPRMSSPGVVVGDYVYFFGGIAYHGGLKGYLNDLARLNYKTQTWEILEVEGRDTEKRASHALAKTAGDNLIIIQGYGAMFLDNVLVANIETSPKASFTHLSPISEFPVGRSHILSSCISHQTKSECYLFGGFDDIFRSQWDFGYNNDIWKITITGR